MSEPPLQIVEDRAELARRQAEVVAALQGRGAPPDAFDGAALRRAGESLARKRSRGVQKAWPLMAAELGETFSVLFEAYARHHSAPGEDLFLDGERFGRWLRGRGNLGDAGKLELARFHVARRGLPAIVWSTQARTLFVMARIGRRVRSWAIKLGRGRD